MTWINAPLETPDKHGFVYEITEISTGMKYIGIKKFWKIDKKKPNKFKRKDGKFLKDKYGKRVRETRTTKKHSKVESDWRTYNSSSKLMQEKLEKNPTNYKKEILHICDSQTELVCREAFIQLNYYFNGDWNLLFNECINLRLRIRKDKNEK